MRPVVMVVGSAALGNLWEVVSPPPHHPPEGPHHRCPKRLQGQPLRSHSQHYRVESHHLHRHHQTLLAISRPFPQNWPACLQILLPPEWYPWSYGEKGAPTQTLVKLGLLTCAPVGEL